MTTEQHNHWDMEVPTGCYMHLSGAVVSMSDYESACPMAVGTQLTQLFILPSGLVDKCVPREGKLWEVGCQWHSVPG